MRKTLFLFAGLLPGLLWGIGNVAQGQPANAELLAEFQQKFHVTTFLVDEKGMPTFIEGELSSKGAQGDETEKAYRFFENAREVFGLTEPRTELALVRSVRDELTMTHIRFHQFHRGVRVYGNEYLAHFSPAGDLQTVNGTFLTGITVPTEPGITRETGVQLALADIRRELGDVRTEPGSSSLEIFDFEGTVHLTWIVWIAVEDPPGDWECFVDALNGSVVYKANRLMDQDAVPGQKKKASEGDGLIEQKVEAVFELGAEGATAPDNDPPKTAPMESEGPPLDFGWTTIHNETFEGVWPLGLWRAFKSGTAPDAYWDDQSYLKHAGYWSAWCADGGTQALPPSGGQYRDNMDAWMIYGPFDLGNASDGEVSFWMNLVSERDYDWMAIMASIDGSYWSGTMYSGNSFGWMRVTFDLGSRCRNRNVWIAFRFTSDYSLHSYPGAFIDDIAITQYLPCPGDYIGRGTGVMGDAKTHLDAYTTCSAYNLMDRTRRANNNIHGHGGAMRSDQSVLTWRYPSTSPMTDADNIWTSSTQASGVDAHVYAGRVYDYLKSALGRNSYDGTGSSMVSQVDNSTMNNNASWSPSAKRVTFYTVTSGHRSMAGAFDVVAHEWGHGVTQFESNLVYQKEPGALNEAFSDMLGVAAGYWTGIDPDWLMGENYNTSGVPVRNIMNPNDRGQPATYIDDPYWYNVVGCTPSSGNDYCGVHRNSGVPNKAFYLLAQGGTFNGVSVTGIGLAGAMRVMYRANAYYWTSSTTFLTAKQGCMTAANDLGGSTWRTRAANAWLAVRVGPAITVTPTSTLAFGDVPVGNSSVPLSYTVSARNLTANLVITAPAGFKLSLNNTTFSTSLSIAPSGGTVVPRSVIVRFDPASAASYSASITHTSSGATTQRKTVTGRGTANVVRNGGFESGTTYWTFSTNGVGSFAAVTPGQRGDKAGRVSMTSGGSTTNLYQQGLTIQRGVQYRLKFAAKSNTGHDVGFALEKQVSPYTNYGLSVASTNIGTAWATFTRTFTTTGTGSVSDARLRFILGPFDAGGDQFFFDQVVLERVTTEGIAREEGEEGAESLMPDRYALLQNYPNPFNPVTTIEYLLPMESAVDLRIYNPLGQEVAVLVQGTQPPGRYSAVWSGQDNASGVYYCRLRAGDFTQTIKLLLVK